MHGIKVGPEPLDSEPWDPATQDLGTPSKFKYETLGLLSKFTSETHIMVFLYCFTYYILYKKLKI